MPSTSEHRRPGMWYLTRDDLRVSKAMNDSFVVGTIFKHLVQDDFGDIDIGTVKALSMASKQFRQEALRALWSEVRGVERLRTSSQRATRGLNGATWTQFSVRRAMIRYLVIDIISEDPLNTSTDRDQCTFEDLAFFLYPCMRNFPLVGLKDFSFHQLCGQLNASDVLRFQQFWQTLPELAPHLTTMTVSGILPPTLQHIVATTVATMLQLECARFLFEGALVVAQFSEHPNLRRLDLVQDLRQIALGFNALTRLPSLTELHISGTAEALARFLTLVSCQSLAWLYLDIGDSEWVREDILDLCMAVSLLRHRLRSLSINLYDPCDDYGSPPHPYIFFPLASCTDLKSFHIVGVEFSPVFWQVQDIIDISANWKSLETLELVSISPTGEATPICAFISLVILARECRSLSTLVIGVDLASPIPPLPLEPVRTLRRLILDNSHAPVEHEKAFRWMRYTWPNARLETTERTHTELKAWVQAYNLCNPMTDPLWRVMRQECTPRKHFVGKIRFPGT